MSKSRPIAALLLLLLALTACTRPQAAAPEPGGPADPGNSAAAGSGTAPTGLAGATIAIDPGHNGGNAAHPEVVNELVDVITKKKPCDTTGTETDAGYSEHAFNWDVAVRLKKILEAEGATVLLTRDGDDGVGPCITQRADIANKADVAVSIHADGGSDEGTGFHIMEPVLIKGHTDDIVKPSHELALAIRDAYEKGTGMEPADYIGEDGINPRDDMGGLNLTRVPKVMVECGNMRHEGDAAKLTDPDWRQKAAESIAEGIADYLSA